MVPASAPVLAVWAKPDGATTQANKTAATAVLKVANFRFLFD